ncbi:unnamed protein product [Albugo candida]|uniref:Uncharacterized protein n=1 Tax=Albugo candida TaxID=65357 RepID=A0A024FXM3_9STRA|nr:unnamed protein product [Albugo candida]|eukprot:CCI11662.1 unnamed protein product [Albugo candida]
MTSTVTAEEVTQAFRALNNNRAPDADHVTDELLKYSPPVVCDILAKAINRHIQNLTPSMRESLVIITVPKTNKPTGGCANLRSPFSEPLSGFRVAEVQLMPSGPTNVALRRRFKTNMYILGIDLIKAFDTIDRHQLLIVLDLILDPDEVQLIKALLSTITLQLRLGDSLSLLLFVVYLEAKLRNLSLDLKISMRELSAIVFIDDVDFIHYDPTRLEHILLVASE